MRRRNTLATVALVALLVLSLPASVGLGGAQDSLTAVDEDNPLATPDAGTTYDNESVVSGDVPGYDLQLTVAQSHQDVGLEGLEYTSTGDTMRHYLRVDYDEDIERTIRFYVDREVWHPHYRELDAENADVTATLEPVGDSEYTAVELTLSGETDAVFQVPKAVSGYYYARDTGRSWLENKTGYNVPSVFSGGAQWDRVDHNDLADSNESVAIGTNESEPMIQYDTGNESERWVPVPSCDSSRGDDAPVCTYERPDDPDHVYVLAEETADPPPVRYKHGTDMLSQARAGINELLETPSRIMDQINGLFGGGE